MYRILCPVDFSPGSLNALLFAYYIHSKIERSELHIITVQASQAAKGHFSSMVLELVEDKKYQDALQSFVELAFEQTGIKLNPKLTVIHSNEKVSDLIKDLAIEEDSDLICMGTEGANQWKKKLLGSTTQNVLEKVNCNVLAIPSKASFHGIKNIALGVDFLYFNEDQFELAYLFREIVGKELHVFDVNIANNPLMEDKMKALKEKYAHLNHLSFSLIDAIEVVEGITNFTRKYPVDLLIVISKKYSFLQRLFERSYTEELVLHTNVPVLVLKS